MTGAVLLLAAVTLERLFELWLAQRNTATLIAGGGREVASGHYVLIVLLHAAWLAGLWIEGWSQPIHAVWLAVFLALQGLRVWVLATLGRRWTTRINIFPGEFLVRAGPYRWISHPNYVVVIGEIAALPLALGLPIFAVVSTVANLCVLAVRIKSENAALAGSRDAIN